MKRLLVFVFAIALLGSCEKEDTNTDDNNPNTHTNTITTWAHTFQPSTLNCNIGDTIYFDLGGSHNAIEVSEDSYNNNDPTPIENGFEFGYGQSGIFIPVDPKTYYYVCVPHLPEMKAKIIVQ